LIDDPLFYLVAVPAVLLFGIAKGGFGGALGMLAVPLMALVVMPLQAAAILLPILCLMDLVSLWVWRGRWLWPELRIVLPASFLGIGLGALTFGFLSPELVRLLLGVIAVVFTVTHWLQAYLHRTHVQVPYGRGAGVLAGAAAGFTSFIAHAGGPPITLYLLRRGLDRSTFVATTVAFFAVVNYVKLVPYAWLGQFDTSNLATSLILAPLAPLGVGLGVWLHKRVSEKLFFNVAWTTLFLVGLKLVSDGAKFF
jgi:uncharacterized membrane protein YfcA